jgi:hypothetical protein
MATMVIAADRRLFTFPFVGEMDAAASPRVEMEGAETFAVAVRGRTPTVDARVEACVAEIACRWARSSRLEGRASLL